MRRDENAKGAAANQIYRDGLTALQLTSQEGAKVWGSPQEWKRLIYAATHDIRRSDGQPWLRCTRPGGPGIERLIWSNSIVEAFTRWKLEGKEEPPLLPSMSKETV